MQIPVFIESIAGSKFRATTPFGFAAEGATRDEALLSLRALIDARLAAGAQMTALTVPSVPENWLHNVIGSMKAYPEFEEVTRLGAEYRRSSRPDDDG